MAVLDELLVAIGLDADDLTRGVAGLTDDVEQGLNDVDAAGAGADVGGDYLNALASALTPGDLDGELANLLDATDEATAAGDAAGDALGDGLAEGAADGAAQAADNVEQGLGSIQAAAVGAAAGAAFLAGMQSAMDISTVTARLDAQLGLTPAQAEQVGTLAGAVFAQGFGESVDDVGVAVAGVASNLADLDSAGTAELESLTQQALGLADAFGQDVGQATRAAGQLMRTGMAPDAQTAMDIIAAGFSRGADAGGDFLDTIIGGADNLSSFGFTGAQATGVIVQGLNAGAESAESVTGLFEELVGNVSAGGDDLAATFDELGLNAQQMATDLTSGGPAANAALDQLLDSIRALEDPIKQDAIVAGLFGEEGAAMQRTLLAIDPSSATAALGDFGGAAAEVATTMQATPAQQMDAAMRSLQMTLGSALLPALTAVSTFMAENQAVMQVAIPVVLALAAGLGIAAIAQWAMNSALLASPITWIILGVVALVAAIVMIATQTTVFQDIWHGAMDAVGAAWDWIWGKLQAGFNFLRNLIVNWSLPGLIITHWDSIKGTFGAGVDWIEDKVDAGIDRVKNSFNRLRALPGDIADWFSGLGSDIADPIREGFRNGINGIISGWNGLSFTLPSVDLGPLGSIGGGTISTPNVPYLADGGITTGPTLAVIGEGPEQEAVLPLSRLDSMLRSVQPAVRNAGAHRVEAVLRVEGDGGIAELIRRAARGRGGPELLFAEV
ncbi:phage tail tape measure protein [Streptomyces sp. URMC 129]|uniref:phage tail tape measure protein n=1 Tax=Streptomyces sp. URMC 129 TaxID=3423407 RepID=UPI003F19D636